jgi:hypothetical protein
LNKRNYRLLDVGAGFVGSHDPTGGLGLGGYEKGDPKVAFFSLSQR